MKKSKIKSKGSKIPSPFGRIDDMTEWSAVAVLMHWMRNIIEEEQLDLGMPDVDTRGKDGKRPDTVIYESRRSKNIVCVIEAKPPYYDVFDYELKEDARKKATRRKAQYFATTNFKRLIWYNTERVNSMKPLEEQIIDKYELSNIEDLNNLEYARFSEPIKKSLRIFLRKLYSVNSGKEPEPRQAIDDLLVFRLQDSIDLMAMYYREIISEDCKKNKSFAKKLAEWFFEQGWHFTMSEQDFDRAARQTAYLLVNKILFYNLLQTKRPDDLDPLEIPKSLTKGSVLHKTLQAYFEQVLKIDYETIYTTDFIDTIAFPDSREVVDEIKKLINVLNEYDFSKIGYEIIGRIFERLIPPEERHNLGQYFTNPDVVDIILRFCLNNIEDKILDPSCGAGTFLVRAYQHKKIMNEFKKHEDILDTLWGIDIAKFPAHLSTINLAINDLGIDRNYPNIIHDDFFDLMVGDDGWDPMEWRKVRAKTLGIKERDIVCPRWFNAVVGNPPYTRQEEIKEIAPEIEEYKKNIMKRATTNIKGIRIADISKRAGIHAYFFTHGLKFLKDGGYFGFVVSNSWLDVEWGGGLQEFFMRNYKIIAIIDSKVERWFEDADINTCIVILQKCRDKKERENNLVRFVYLKKPLSFFIPPAKDIWEKQVERINAIDKLKRTILAHYELYEDDDLRVYPKRQSELWDEGYDREDKRYIGSKWGKYIRAPDIFFKILEKGKDKLIPLKEIADVRFGIKTGANEFFYLTEEDIKRWKIEKEFWMHKEGGRWVPNYVIKSPRECRSIVVNPEDLKYRVLMIHRDKEELKGTNVLKYIEYGEERGFHLRPTCASRKRWYDLGKREFGDGFWIMTIRSRHITYLNNIKVFADARLYDIYLRKIKPVISILNTTLNILLIEILSRGYGGGGGPIDIKVYEVERIPVPLKLEISEKVLKNIVLSFEKMKIRDIGTVFEEIGANSPDEVSLDKVKPDRRELDKIIMGDILGLSDDEQLEVYRAVVDLVRSRIDKARSIKSKKSKRVEIEREKIKEEIVDRIREE